MDNRKSEKNTEIWFKYCEECVKIACDALQKTEKKSDTVLSDTSENS